VRFAVAGSGSQGQAECMGYALAKALIKINPDHKRILAKFGFVGSDFRKKEPKKTNLYSARVRPPYVRR
jgi:small subunit ribosomal protein S9